MITESTERLKESLETKAITYSHALEVAIGQKVAEILNLKMDKKTGYFNTIWGTKSVRGLGATIMRIVEDQTELFADCKPKN